MKKKTRIIIAVAAFLAVSILVGVLIKTVVFKEVKLETEKWYSIQYGELDIYEFKENGKFEQSIIDLWNCEKETIIGKYELEENKLILKEREHYEKVGDEYCKYILEDEYYEYVIENQQLHMIRKDEGLEGGETIYYNTFEKAKADCEEYEYTTYALQKIVDDEGFAVKGDVLLAYLGDEEELTIPEGIKEIETEAFSADLGRGENLKKVTIGNDVKKINNRAFFFAAAEVIIIEEGVEEIGDECFSDCYMREIYFPASVQELGEIIMETEEGLDGTIIHCVEDSAAAQYFEKNMPYGYAELKYEPQKNE